MTRNNDTTYREKGRAAFLATMMVLSVVAVSVAFTGGAAAVVPANTDSLSDEDPLYAGQEFNTSVDVGTDFGQGDSAFLVEVSRDDGDIDGFEQTLSTENPVADTAAENFYEIDTEGLNPGNEYAISNTSSFRGSDTAVVQEFTIINEGFELDFDDDSVDNTDTASELELSSDRSIENYNVTVSVDGPDTFDADMIDSLFNISNNPDYEVTNDEDVPLDGLDDYDREDDTQQDLRDDDLVTLDLSNISDAGTDIDGDNLLLNFDRLAEEEDLPDDGEYEFEFYVTDTGATATDTISISEQDEDASFNTSVTRTAAGDLADFSLTLEDTDETWLQIGGDDSDFTEVIYLAADDESEPMDVNINTRLLGSANVDSEDVYDTDNVDTLESGIHDVGATGTFTNVPDGAVLFGDDGAENNNFNDYLNDIDSGDSYNNQLTRPLQATDYQVAVAGTDVNDDEALFDADPGGEANNQLASKSIELTQPEIGEITVHTAPEESADDTSEVAELVDAATPSEEVALDDQLVVQVEATGIYGSLVTNASDYDDTDYDRLSEGASTNLLNELEENANEGITFEVTAESSTGNQDPLEVDLTASDQDTFLVLDEDNGQFFLVADTSSDGAFDNGAAPDSATSFTATMEYSADNEDDRYEFDSDDPFDETDGSEDNYPYLLQGETLDNSATFDLAPRSIDFDNVNADDQVQAQATDGSEISGTTNVAPGSEAEVRITSTDASSSFRQGNDVNISEDGSVTTTYDLADQEVGDEFGIDFRVGGSSTDTADGVIVEAVSDEPADDGETNETDDGDMDDGEEPADDGETNESTDDGGESTDDGTPGFGAVVALIALIGAALLAVRRQN